MTKKEGAVNLAAQMITGYTELPNELQDQIADAIYENGRFESKRIYDALFDDIIYECQFSGEILSQYISGTDLTPYLNKIFK